MPFRHIPHPSKSHFKPLAAGVTLILGLSLIPAAHSTELQASDGTSNNFFGYSVSLSGTNGLVGAYAKSGGGAYFYENIDVATGTIDQDAKLVPSDAVSGKWFARSVSLSGNSGVVGAPLDDVGGSDRGSAYYFRNLNTATGTVTQTIKLGVDPFFNQNFDYVGTSVSLSGNIAAVGSPGFNGTSADQGTIYIYTNLDTATGAGIGFTTRLSAYPDIAGAQLGTSVSLSGHTLIGGAPGVEKAYVFQNVDGSVGGAFDNAILTASDSVAGNKFGQAVHLSGSAGIVGAPNAAIGAKAGQGAAYVYRGVDTASATVTQNAKLIASDGAASDAFGTSVSVSGANGLVGANLADFGHANQGAAYLYRNLDTATGTVTQSLRITASGGAANDNFGVSVSLDGDNFLIGASGVGSSRGRAYAGSVSSMTTLDTANASRTIDGLSFTSQEDWIVGQNYDGMTVLLGAGDAANVTASGKAVSIGRNAGSDDNTLIVAGNLTANEVYIGSTAGNEGNVLQLESSAAFGTTTLRLAQDNLLSIEGDFSDIELLLGYLGASTLQVWDGSWNTITAENASSLLSFSAAAGYTNVTAVPEPGTAGLVIIFVCGLAILLRKRRKAPPASLA